MIIPFIYFKHDTEYTNSYLYSDGALAERVQKANEVQLHYQSFKAYLLCRKTESYRTSFPGLFKKFHKSVSVAAIITDLMLAEISMVQL